MSRHRTYSSLVAATMLLAFTSPAFANSIAPTFYFWPGVLPLMLGLALPASVLAAVLERPFVSRAGVTEYAFWYSMQANFISLVLGYLTLPVGVEAVYTIGPFWSLIAVAMSVVSEGWYYRWRAIKGQGRLRWGWIVAGNGFSSFVLLFLPPVALAIKEAQPQLVWDLKPYQGGLFWGSVSGSVVVFVGSFFAPGLQGRFRALPNKVQHLNGASMLGSPEFQPVETPSAGKR